MHKMFKLLVLLTAEILIGEVSGTPRQLVDIDTILENLVSQGNTLEGAGQNKIEFPNENTQFNGSPRANDINKMTRKHEYSLFNERNIKPRYYINADDILRELNMRYTSEPKHTEISRLDYDQTKEVKDNEISDGDTDQNKRFNDKALADLLSQNVLGDKVYGSSMVAPNSLVGSSELYRSDIKSKSEGYSKIYVILNPYAINRSKNQEELNSLLSRVLSLTEQSNKLEKRNKQNRYKGFPIKKGFISRRLRRDSREIYTGKDSKENDYKPKRMRNDHSGVGGAGGRTAIPYIRNRGDIYERDH